MSVWFEGKNEIDCTIEQIKNGLSDIGEHFVNVTKLMPGLTSVEIVKSGDGFVTIKTNEGLMKRTKISTSIEVNIVVIEFDEEYQAGKLVNNNSHVRIEFTGVGNKTEQRTVITNQDSKGILGFFFGRFGKSSTGNAFLDSYKTYFENA